MKVEVLMSTYNGEKYLKQQLDSLKNQSVPVHILARDDGSIDETVEILNSYDSLEIIKGKNIGSTESFLTLIELAPEADYYAFSDQDDVWDINKIECAIQMLKEYDVIPAVYSSNSRLVNDKLQFIKDEKKCPKTDLGSAIIKNYVTGCTVVFNRKLMYELKKYRPINAPFHDWWVNLVCLSIGGVSLFDEIPHISYRQHGNNVVSGNSSFIKKWKSRLIKFFTVRYNRDKVAEEILIHYCDSLPIENQKLLESLAKKKLTKEMRTGKVFDDNLFRICALMNRL